MKADIFGNMALIYFHNKNNPRKAFEFFDQALKIHPANLKIRRDLVQALIIEKNFDTALENVDILLSENRDNGIYHNIKGLILLWQKKYEDALPCFKIAYELVSVKSSIILNTSVALNLAGRHEKAEILLLEAIKYYPNDICFYFAIIENSIRAGEINKAMEYTKIMFKQLDDQIIKQGLEFYTDNPKYAPMSKKIIAPVILSMYEEIL
ncbi:MAG: tetratricopeptide repeat protein [Desulfobacteraceae bacterium]|nr:tetratricopeptide repeat protein [Desulfobacteraceae bacterium]MBC2756907.1 tetratricopeptide repeat protein [Desulfobacteraceae bacterium]